MKRFYKATSAELTEAGYEVRLDGRSVRTPARAPLAVPTQALAEAIAAEWDGQGEQIDPSSMPLTGLANAAIDRIAPEREAFAAGLARYGESDLVCYRAETPVSLVERQAGAWDPLVAWAGERFGIACEVVTGVMHRPQPDATVSTLAAAIAGRSPFALAGLSHLVTVSGSLILALALAEGAVDLETAWSAASLDETFQLEQWGEDAEASKALDARRRDFDAGYRFLTLLNG